MTSRAPAGRDVPRVRARPDFRPHPLLSGGHRQTLLGYWRRRRLRWELPVEDLVVEAGDDVRLLVRASWQPGNRAHRPAVVLVHGLGSSDQASYGLATGQLAWARGWHVLRMNMRGAGDGEALCPRLYNAGLADDLVAVVHAVAAVVPRLTVVGFSLGGNLALLALGRHRGALPPALVAAASVSAPVDLTACADALERPGNRLYQQWFMRGLRASYVRRQGLLPQLYERGRERGLHTVREFDEAITAPYGGFRDVADYYTRSSAGPHLHAIDRPTLILSAADDPMVPAASVADWPLAAKVWREIVPTGGHMGFVAPTAAPAQFWAGERTLAFLEEEMDAGVSAADRAGDARRHP